MKRYFKYISCLILLLFTMLLSSCGAKTTPDSSAPVITDPIPPKPSAILEQKQPSGLSDNLFYLANDTVESGLMQSLLFYDNNFLLCGSDQEGYHLQLISSDTGELLASNSFENIIMPNVQVYGDRIILTDWFDGKILMLDEALQETNRYQVTCEYNPTYVNPDGAKAYTFLPENGLQVTTLATGETETLLENTANLFTSGDFKTNITFAYTDLASQFEMYGALNLETGELLTLPFEGSYFNMCVVNDTWFATQVGTLDTHFVGNRDSLKTFILGNEIGNFTMDPDTGHLLMTSYGSTGFEKLTVYDTNGNFISQCQNSIEGTVVQGHPVWSEADGGYFFIMIDPAGKDLLMFWDVNADCTGDALPLQDYQEEVLPEGVVSKKLYARAKALSESYGVNVRIAEQLFEEYNGYTVEPCFDETQISAALYDVEKALSSYPTGFFDQLLYGSVRKLELHLAASVNMNDIPADSGLGFTSFAGFATTESAYSLIVLDIFSDVESNLHHEIFHIVDDKLIFDAQLRPESNYSEENWRKLNPADFTYAEQLYNLPDTFYNGKYEEWFTGYYARTNAKEDRATIMESAGMGDSNMFIHAPYRQAKLEYLSKCIRDAFDTTGWPETTVWEDTLNQSR